ncbi:MAG TPA: preprotein translocase subunit SecE [Candidatus Peribacterales bacterium]|nr:preprotein translocase subunit SecE [Candidatus Peribacterales bacterium]
MNPVASTTAYIQGAIAELRHVRWPTRHQAVRLSIITIIFTFASSIAYGIVDYILGRGVSFLLLFT